MAHKEDYWKAKYGAFLHDPPDKTLVFFKTLFSKGDKTLTGHEERANMLKRTIPSLRGLNDSIIKKADRIVSTLQRFNLPREFWSENENDQEGCEEAKRAFTIRSEKKYVSPIHPVSLKKLKGVDHFLAEAAEAVKSDDDQQKKDLLFPIDQIPEAIKRSDVQASYFSFWFGAPYLYPPARILPADTRIPDHTILNHLDVTAAFSGIFQEGKTPGLFSVKIPAVQSFIREARSLSDLWAASHLIASLMKDLIITFIKAYGPDMIIFPSLRENPLIIQDLLKEGLLTHDLESSIPEDILQKDALAIATLPNTFLAFIPYEEHEEIRRLLENAWEDAWKNHRENVLRKASMSIKDKERFRVQTEKPPFSLVMTAVPLIQSAREPLLEESDRKITILFQPLHDLLKLAEAEEGKNLLPFSFPSVFRIISLLSDMQARNTLPPLADKPPEKPLPKDKCSLCGKRYAVAYGATSPTSFIKSSERLCGVCLIKRVYGKQENPTGRFESVVSLASPERYQRVKEFLEEQDENKRAALDVEELMYAPLTESEDNSLSPSIQLLSPEERKELQKIRENTDDTRYYALVKLDGDHLGRALRGDYSRPIRDYLLPSYAEAVDTCSRKLGKENVSMLIREIKRPVLPHHHAFISSALTFYATRLVPRIVRKHEGILVYAGGDDILALFPIQNALNAVLDLYKAFRQDYYTFPFLEDLLTDEDIHKAFPDLFYQLGEQSGDVFVPMPGIGSILTMSASITYAHYKWPLWDVLRNVNEGLQEAKNAGRNRLTLTFMSRSGQQTRVILPFTLREEDSSEDPLLLPLVTLRLFNDLKELFSSKNTSVPAQKSIYTLITLAEEGERLPQDLQQSLLRRELSRRESSLGKEEKKEKLEEKLEDFITKLLSLSQEANIPLTTLTRTFKILYKAAGGGSE